MKINEKKNHWNNENAENNEKLTLRQLKAMLKSTQLQKTPTAKALREGAEMVVHSQDGFCTMTVFSNGFAVYRNDKHSTVLRMEYVGTAHYGVDDDDKPVNVSVEDEDWHIGVMLCGEERLEKRYCEMADSRMVSTYIETDDGEEVALPLDSGEDFVEDLTTKDEIHSILDCLTERQREVIKMYYFENKTQQQIANILRIKQQSVNDCLEGAKKKLQKNFQGYL